MKIVAIIPIKTKSKRVRSKILSLFFGKPLFQFLIDKLSDHPFDEFYADTDSKEISRYSKAKAIKIYG